METESSTIQQAADLLGKLRAGIGEAVVGQSRVVEEVVLALVASGHVLIEGVPGLGKTLLVRALSQALQLSNGRVQFTPDMMPSDITGHAVLDPKSHANCASCAGRCSRTCCWPTKSTARRPRRRARCSK